MNETTFLTVIVLTMSSYLKRLKLTNLFSGVAVSVINTAICD